MGDTNQLMTAIYTRKTELTLQLFSHSVIAQMETNIDALITKEAKIRILIKYHD